MDVTSFAESFVGALARDDFHQVGSLDAYLSRPPAERTGDEANIVDARVTRTLLTALGYALAELDYNLTKQNQRPDYVVHIAEYPGPCIIIEDKATAEADLEQHRPQLAAYMTAQRCPRGLLVNGSWIMGFDDAGPARTATLEVPLRGIVRLWRGDDLLAGGRTGWQALGQAEQDALSVLLRRYGRAAFQGLNRLIEDLTLDRDGRPHAPDGSTWKAGIARLPLTDARDNPDGLVEAIQDLIGELREDVAVQFAFRARQDEAFQREIAIAPGSSARAAEVMDAIADRILSVLPKAIRDERGDGMRTRLREAMRGDRPQAEINEVVAEVRIAANARGNGRAGDPLGRAQADARAFATRYARHVLQARKHFDAGVAAAEAFGRWRVAVGTVLMAGASDERIRNEYFAQTAYVVIVRMLLVRILEDKGLTPRVFTNGGAAIWFRQVEPHYFSLSIGRSAARLLEVAYENAQATYAHFYDGHRVFDWYVPDRITLVRVLHRLAGFNLASIDRDIIGTVYGRFVNDRHKHEQGMYYTPTTVVGFILDRIAWQGPGTVGARLLDPACGSGAFLVEAARRVIEAHREQARQEGHAEVPAERVQAVLNSVRESLVGFDLNPFACALAEINLLVQVLDLIAHAHAHRHSVRLERFRVYVTDALRPVEGTRAALEGGLDPSEAADLPEEEQAKARVGLFAQGFDAVVGNPPYVRADEGAAGLLEYRRELEAHPIQAVRDVLTFKWDLFVPFVALGRHLLRAPDGRLGMIVSNAVETVLYASALRRQLAGTARVQEVHFFDPRVKLFEDAAVRNTVLVLWAGAPDQSAETLREWHDGPPPKPRARQRLPQLGHGENVFRPVLPALRMPPGRRAIAIKHACYVSVGMVLNAHERLAPGRFKLDDLLSDVPTDLHTKPYVGSEDLRIVNSPAGDCLFAAARVRYVEYGTDRVPGLIRRPTFPELYDRDKVMVGEFGGAVLDDGTLSGHGHLACNHSVFLFVPWHALRDVRNRALDDRARELGGQRAELEAQSVLIPLPFLAGLFNSTIWDTLLKGRASTSILNRAQPTNFSEQLVPVPDRDLARDVGDAAEAARTEGRALAALLAAGWQRHAQGWLSPPAVAAAVQQAAFAVARTRWGLVVERPTARCASLRREGTALLAGSRVAARLPEGSDPDAADFLLRVLKAQGQASLQLVEAQGLHLPLKPEDAAEAERALVRQERQAEEREQRILARRAEIDALLAPLFEPIDNPPIEQVLASA